VGVMERRQDPPPGEDPVTVTTRTRQTHRARTDRRLRTVVEQVALCLLLAGLFVGLPLALLAFQR